ncbi:MAG: lysophospholipid acyltransferase family protein [Clostridiaceae bacterium]
MISPGASKFIGMLPQGLIKFLANKILYGYVKKFANIRITGMDNLKGVKKPIIFISNHLSNSDALVLNKTFKDQDLTFVAGVKLNDNVLTNLGIHITKTIQIHPNTADKDAISNIVKYLRAGNNVLVFPEGTRSRTGKMIEAKKGIVLIQRLSKATVIPVGLAGTEKLLPINDSDMAREEFHYADVNVSIGKPIEIAQREKDEDRKEYDDKILNIFMKSIAALLPEDYRGVYS